MSDHFSGPRALAGPAGDISDVFAFPSPERPGHLVLAMTVLPLAGPDAFFSDAIICRFRLRPLTIEADRPAFGYGPEESELVFGLSQLRHVADGDDRPDTRFHRERCGRVRHPDHRAVPTEEPVVIDADALPRQPWLQKRAVVNRIGRAVRTLVVRHGVAVLTKQLRLVFVAEERHRSRVHEREVAIVVDDV